MIRDMLHPYPYLQIFLRVALILATALSPTFRRAFVGCQDMVYPRKILRHGRSTALLAWLTVSLSRSDNYRVIDVITRSALALVAT